MKYMLLIYFDERALSQTEREQCYEESAEFARQINEREQYLAAAPLHPTSTATSVRVRDGKRLVTDGPFAETREQLGATSSSVPRTSMRRSTSLRGFQQGAGAPWRSPQSWRSQAYRLREFDESISLVLVRLLWQSAGSVGRNSWGYPSPTKTIGYITTRFTIIVKPRKNPEGGKTPSEDMLIAMGG
jgi:hypothetical protein